ncbi:MAG: rod shape-determining protein MreD [Acidobacteria bacterium RIFCSPLOWO2_12_FULL_67_14]|nr:MAG: rod shape-determining protein MreD [Acidobacteria bacterium RIFCSPLOWO2_02_FULL_67_21]OFW39236.1 MAG: rod shape-determining protein MreD [Acidobacteria bacterium RIFCSPLOWO2_12_FULL_67_14]
MRAVGVLIAIAMAIALQTTLARFLVAGTAAVDLVLVVVIYVALTGGAVTGMLAGSFAGIIQDALSSGVIGIGGLAKLIVGFLAGAIGQQFIVTSALPRFLTFLVATVVHAAVFMGLYVLLGLRSFPSPWTAILSQAVGNAAVGMIAFTVLESLPGVAERRRAKRRM